MDLNCDVGEGIGDDERIVPQVSSVNIACGGHAGDEHTMSATVRCAIQHRVAIGAHPGYPDRAGFGRREMSLNGRQAYESVLEQISALDLIVHREGGQLRHVKPHGALYHRASEDANLADALVRAIGDYRPTLWLYAPPASALVIAASKHGVRVAVEGFVDRRYDADGRLTSRSHPEALWNTVAEVVEQARQIALRGCVTSRQGATIPLAADTLCLHGDHPFAVDLAAAVRRALVQAGIPIAPPSEEGSRQV